MTTFRRSRWAISFADLCLLLLGFFVLLNASRQGPGAAVSQLSEYFGGKPGEAQLTDLTASALFEPGEAMLTPKGAAQLREIGQQAIENKRRLILTSVGEDRAGRRFDRWELSAARLAAAARALRETGLAEDRIGLRGLDESNARAAGQHLIIRQERVRETGR